VIFTALLPVVFFKVVIVLPFLLIQIYNAYFDCANFFKDIFKIFSKLLKIKDKKTAANSTYPKAGVQWLNQALCFYLSSSFIVSLVFQNPRLRVAAKR